MEENTIIWNNTLYKIDLEENVFSEIQNRQPHFYKKWNKRPEKMEVSSEIHSRVLSVMPRLPEYPQLFGIDYLENENLKPNEFIFKVK